MKLFKFKSPIENIIGIQPAPLEAEAITGYNWRIKSASESSGIAMHLEPNIIPINNKVHFDKFIIPSIEKVILDNIRKVAKDEGIWHYGEALLGAEIEDGRDVLMKVRTLYTKILKTANRIAKDTKRGAGNFMIVSEEVLEVLKILTNFMHQPIADTPDNPEAVDVPVVFQKVGTFDNRITVYVDYLTEENSIVVGYVGQGLFESGLIFSPKAQSVITSFEYPRVPDKLVIDNEYSDKEDKEAIKKLNEKLEQVYKDKFKIIEKLDTGPVLLCVDNEEVEYGIGTNEGSSNYFKKLTIEGIENINLSSFSERESSEEMLAGLREELKEMESDEKDTILNILKEIKDNK